MVCKYCNQEMTVAESCPTFPFEWIGGEVFERVTFHDENKRCHDCGIVNGVNLHHPGCDVEECPKCGGQVIGCECGFDEDHTEYPDRILLEVAKKKDLHLTWADLRDWLNKQPDETLKQDVTVYTQEDGEFRPGIGFTRTIEDDVLDAGHLYLFV